MVKNPIQSDAESVYLAVQLTDTALDYAYANIVNLEPENVVVNSFTTNPLFRFIRFYPSYDSDGIDTRLPTLYVGYKQAKERFGVNILTPQFQSMAWWCASPQEDSMRFLKGFQEFLSQIAPSLVETLTTKRTDPIFGPAHTSSELLELFQEQQLLVAYLRKGAYHIYTSADEVLVIDSFLYGIYGIDTSRLRQYIEENSKHFHDDQNDAIFHFFTNRFEYDPSHVSKYIPYLIWIKARGLETAVEEREMTQILHN